MPASASGTRVRDWILDRASSAAGLGELLEGFAAALEREGVAIDWLSVHSQQLSPTQRTTTHRWSRHEGRVATKASDGDPVADAKSPLFQIWQGGSETEGRLGLSTGGRESRFVGELRNHGLTHFLTAPVPRWVQRPSAVVFGTVRPSGFSQAELAILRDSLRAFRTVLELHETRRLIRTVLRTYLGQSAAEAVLRGSIRRGECEMIHAILLYSDLRDFTPISERTAVPHLTDLLDRYFETISRPVQDAGGEILKFIGDGLLAVFPCPVGHVRGCPTAQRALGVAREAQRAMASRRRQESDFDLRCGVALHVGDVLFGNVGASDRLDFTVIGPAVNLVTRMEALSKTTESKIVASREFALREGSAYTSVGRHALKGIAEPCEILSPCA